MAWLCAVTAIAYIHRNCLAVPAAQIQEDLGLSESRMGLVMGSFFFVYALSQIPAGWLSDRWGSRLVLPLIAVAWSLAAGSVGLTVGLISILACQVINGAGQADVFPSSANTLSKWFPASHRGLPLGLIGSFQSVGLITANLLTATLLVHVSWRLIFPLVSILGFAWAAGFYLWFRDRPDNHPHVNDAELKIIRGPTTGRSAMQSGEAQLEEKPPPPPGARS